MKGIVVDLPQNFAQELREGKPKGASEWDDVIPMPRDFSGNESGEAKKEPRREQCGDNDDEDDDASYALKSMPTIQLNLQSLLGYVPEEDELSLEQIREALFSSNNSLDKLMESGIAQHMLTTETPMDDKHIQIHYPDFIVNTENKLQSTSKTWRFLLKCHPISVVERLLQQLRMCHKSLWWKEAMCREIRSLADTETSWREMQRWKSKRPKQLEELYAVRDTLQHCYDEACAKLERLEAERDLKAKAEFTVHTIENNDDLIDLFPRDSDDNSDFESDCRAGFLGDDGHYSIHSESSSSVFGDATDDQGDGEQQNADDLPTENAYVEDDEPTATVTATESTSNTYRSFSHQPQSTEQEENAARLDDDGLDAEVEAHFPEITRVLSADEKQVIYNNCLEKFTTTELKMAQTASQILEQRLESVDELLENLQDQEWAAQESEDDGLESHTDNKQDPREFGLLDQILAMILGSSKMDTKDIFQEHTDITSQWKSHFGRLPPSTKAHDHSNEETTIPQTPENVSDTKEALGIVDNYDSEWDSEGEEPDSDEGLLEQPQMKVGLRPGSRLVMP